MIEWERPTGSNISTNDDKRNIEAAKKLGWKRVKPKKKRDQEQQPLLGN